MESKTTSIHSKISPTLVSPQKDIIGVVSEEIFNRISSDLKENSVDEDGVGRLSKGHEEIDIAVDGEVVRSPCTEKQPYSKNLSGKCRTCCITLDMEEDGRIGVWIDPEDGRRVVIDGTGLCEDCEYKRSIETDPNWGRSRRISSEERSYEEKCECSSDVDEVSSASPSKKKQ